MAGAEHVKLAGEHFPVPVGTIDHDTLEMDLYLRYDGHAEMTLYRGAGVRFMQEDADRLAEQGVRFLYVPLRQHTVYRRALCKRLEGTFGDQKLTRAERGRVVREACSKMIEDVMLFPGHEHTIQAVADISRTFAAWSERDTEGFGYLLDMSTHDFYTITHMVNVGVGCGLLAKALEINEPDLVSVIVQGGLLHDVGKRHIPEEILNKEGKLAPEEWEQVRMHPTLGYEELHRHRNIPEMVLEMARDHHERPDGNGYPSGRKGAEIGLVARICAVVDVYDSLTAARPYRGPIPPLDALKMMKEGAGSQFDPHVLETWERLVEQMVEHDSSRAVSREAGGGPRSLTEIMPRPSLEAGVCGGVRGPANSDGAERRRHTRFRCELWAEAIFERQGKPCPVGVGEAFQVLVTDVSQGGVQLETSWPFTLNDILLVHLPRKDGGKIKRYVRVVRVRSAPKGRWAAGACFLGENAGEEPRQAA